MFNFIVPLTKAFEGADGYTYLEGVASTVDVDRDSERFSAKALRKMYDEIISRGVNLFGDHEHSWKNAFGVLSPEGSSVNEKSFKTRIRLEKTNHPASPVPYLLDKINSGINLGLSVGGNVLKTTDEFNKELRKKITVIDDLELFEVSVVGIPSNKATTLSVAGAIAKSFHKENIAKSCPNCFSKDVHNGTCNFCASEVF